MNLRQAHVLLCVLIGLLVAACMQAPSQAKPVYFYTLDYPEPTLAVQAQLPYVVRVNRFSVSPPFNTQRIVYADGGLYRNSYPLQQWISEPGDLVAYFIARDLRHSGAFKAVLTPDANLGATHAVYGWVEEFLEQDLPASWQASLRLHITLVAALDPDPSRRILFQKSYSATAPCDERSPAALARAMSTALGQVSAEVCQDLYRRLQTSTTQP